MATLKVKKNHEQIVLRVKNFWCIYRKFVVTQITQIKILKLRLIDSRQKVVLDGCCVALPWRFIFLSISSVNDDRTINKIFDDKNDAEESWTIAAICEWSEKTQMEQNFTKEIRLADFWPPTWGDETVIVQCWQCCEI